MKKILTIVCLLSIPFTVFASVFEIQPGSSIRIDANTVVKCAGESQPSKTYTCTGYGITTTGQTLNEAFVKFDSQLGNASCRTAMDRSGCAERMKSERCF